MTDKSKQEAEAALVQWLKDRLYANARNIKVGKDAITFQHGRKSFKITVERHS